MYSEPLINTSFIIVMVFLLSTTNTILNMMRGIVLLTFRNSIGCAALPCFNRVVITHWNVGSSYGPLSDHVKKAGVRVRWFASTRELSVRPIACDYFRKGIARLDGIDVLVLEPRGRSENNKGVGSLFSAPTEVQHEGSLSDVV